MIGLELRDDGGPSWTLEGPATTWSEYEVEDFRGRYRERFARGAFAGAVSGRDRVALRVEHSRDNPPLASTHGGSLSFREDDSGLILRAALPKNERDVADAVSKVKRGVLTGLSVGFSPPLDETWSSDRSHRVIHSARLWETSLVHSPANSAATVTSVRAGEAQFEVRYTGTLAVVEARATDGKYTAAQIAELGEQGKAFRNPDGHYSFPIVDRQDVLNAIHAIGRSGLADKAPLRRYIIKRAAELNASRLIPRHWSADGTLSKPTGRSLTLVNLGGLRRELGLKPRLTRAHRGPTSRDRQERLWLRLLTSPTASPAQREFAARSLRRRDEELRRQLKRAR